MVFMFASPQLSEKDVFKLKSGARSDVQPHGHGDPCACTLTYLTFYLAPGAERNIDYPVTREHSGRK